MIWRTDKPKGSPIIVYRDGNPRPEVLFLATKPYPHYYDDGGEEIPDGMIQKWASLEESSLPSNLDEAAEKYVSTLCDRADEGLRIDTTLESAFKASVELIISELFEKLKITPLKVIGKDEYGYPVYDFEVGHYYRTFTLFGEKYKCDQTDSGKAGEQMQAGQGFSFEDEVIFDGIIPFLKNADFDLLDPTEHFREGDRVIVQIRKKD